MIKKFIIACALSAAVTAGAQTASDQGFGGVQSSDTQARYSQKIADLNYADDGEAYHTLDIYLPEKGVGPFPVVVHIYGSAWFSNSSKGMADINTICAALLDAGYAVATPNHRSSGDAKYPAQINDIKAVVRYLRANAGDYNLDPGFVGVSGFSSGAHLASLMGATNGVTVAEIGDASADLEGAVGKYTDQSSKVDAVCEWSGPIDLLNMDCAGPATWTPSPEEVVMGMPLKGHEDNYRLLSPVYMLDKSDVPYLVFHGDEDNVVPVCQGRIMAQALADNGVAYEYVEVPGGGHGFKMYSAENLKKMTDFFDAQRNHKKVSQQ